MKFQVAIAVCMLISTTSANSCEGYGVKKHEKDDCSDEGSDDSVTKLAIDVLIDKCQAISGKSAKVTCDDKGMKTAAYSDAECKTEIAAETVTVKWGECNKKFTLVAPPKPKDGEATTGAHMIQAALGSLVLGAISYMA